MIEQQRRLAPEYDPWDPIYALRQYGHYELTSVEMTVTHLCNMRCEHCAVGDVLTMKEGELLPLSLMLERLDELEHLQTISITGGEPTFRRETVRDYIIPLLKYARERGVFSQINSNLTLDYERYEEIAPYLDVMHISFNYTGADDFYEIGFARSGRPVSRQAAVRMYERMISNADRLSRGGLKVSAESMINYRTHRKITKIHRLIDEMGCWRHEVHPMYPSDFAAGLPKLSLDEMREAVGKLLDVRNRDMWMLFGTFPFYPCSPDTRDRNLWKRLREAPNVTVRNDPDGRNRLNVDLLTGNVYVTDFASLSSFGNIRSESLGAVFSRWLKHPVFAEVNCHCPAADCCGPNLLVRDMYYRDVDFRERQALLD